MMKKRRLIVKDEDNTRQPCPNLPSNTTVLNGSKTSCLRDDDSDSSGSISYVPNLERVMNSKPEDDHPHQTSRFLLRASPTLYLKTFRGRSKDIGGVDDNRLPYRGINCNVTNNNTKNITTNTTTTISSIFPNIVARDEPSGRTRNPQCARCKIHKIFVPLKNHKRYCPFRYCPCYDCFILTQRQKVMALNVALRRAQAQDEKTGYRPVYDEALLCLRLRSHVTQTNPILQPVAPLVPSPPAASTKCGSVNATEHHRRLQALKQMLESFHSQGVDGTLICSYIILKECDFVVDKAFEKILDARNDIGSYTGRDPSNLVAPSSNNYWSTVVPQGAASPSTALLYPQLNCLPPYYGYPFPSSAAAAASGNAAATAAAAAAWQAAAGASGSGHPLMKAEPISLCSYPPVVQHPSSAGALNSVSSSLGGPGPPPPMMEIATSGDSRGSDCRGDESDREDRGAPGQERSVSVDRGMGSNDDVQSDRTPPGPGTEEAATSPTSALVLRSSFQPTSLSFAALHSYKNRTQSIES